MRLGVSDWAANQAVQRAFSDALPESMPLGQKMVLSALFICAEGPDQPVEESHTDLAALAGLELAGYFSCLLKLKFAGFVTDDGQGLRIDHSAIRAADAGDGAPNAKQLTRGFERRGRDAACVAMQVPLDALDAVLHGLSLTAC
jgi:hypothetical protein